MNLLGQLGLLGLLVLSPVWPTLKAAPDRQAAAAKTVTLQAPAPDPTKVPGAVEPVIGAKSALLVDLPSGQTLFQKDPDAARPIASLAKLMTALVTVEHTKPNDIVTIGPLHNTPEESLAGFAE